MGKKTREDLSYLSKRRYKTKTRISKCYDCNNYFINTRAIYTRCNRCLLARLTALDKVAIATLCPNLPPFQTAPIPAESSVSSSGPLTT